MIAVVQGLKLLHFSGVASGLLVVPLALVVLAFLGVLVWTVLRWHGQARRQARCPHHEVRYVQQPSPGSFYFVEQCMACNKQIATVRMLD